MADWMYCVNDTEYGPVNSRQLKELAAQGDLRRRIWCGVKG